MVIELHDPRPDDMPELARLTAIELRKRGISAQALEKIVRLPGVDLARRLCWHPYSITFDKFDNLGPIGCADVIQAEESRRAQEWAKDTQ